MAGRNVEVKNVFPSCSDLDPVLVGTSTHVAAESECPGVSDSQTHPAVMQPHPSAVCTAPTGEDFTLFYFYYFIYFILLTGKGREKGRERNISWLPLMHPQPGAWPTTQTCTPAGNRPFWFAGQYPTRRGP